MKLKQKQRFIRISALAFIGLAAFIMLGIQYRNSNKDDLPLVFSPRTMLASLWESYKEEYWETSTGRTVDKQRGSITTSEGQSYTMLRAAWQGDRETFDKTWAWTKDHLQHQDDKLFAWKWGALPDGTYGVLAHEGGNNTAADGDVDIAFALLMAASKWQQPNYKTEAQAIIGDIWEHEVLTVDGQNYLAANNLEKVSRTDKVVNPSYFAPYAFKVFQRVDPDHEWDKLTNDSYALVSRSMDQPLDKGPSVGLPPDWFIIDRNNGNLKASTTTGLTTNYSYDASRVAWRLALDYEWNKDERAKKILEQMDFLSDQWRANKQIKAAYTHGGAVAENYETASMYGTSIGLFVVVDPNLAREVYDTKLRTLYSSDSQTWSQEMSYYGDNWAWFGLALYNNLLDNSTGAA